MSKARIPASLGGIEFDCTISRERSYEADIPEYPVEDGYYVSDSIHKKPLTFELVVFVTNMPVTWAKRHAGNNRVKNTIDSLVDLYLSGKLSTLVTPDKVYENMGITKLSVTEEDYVNAAEITLSLKQVTVTSADIIVVSSYNYSGSSSDGAGSSATTEESSTPKKKSILSSLLGWLFK